MNIYILQLEQNKYYIGKTNNINNRLTNHLQGYGSSWTNKYKPLYLIELIENCDDFDENKYTKKYMAKYGIGNVRGGSYTKLILSNQEIEILKKEINGSLNKCYNCNQLGHFANECTVNTIKTPNTLNNVTNYIKTNKKCYKCGRVGHFVKNCYAKTDINGNFIGYYKKYIPF